MPSAPSPPSGGEGWGEGAVGAESSAGSKTPPDVPLSRSRYARSPSPPKGGEGFKVQTTAISRASTPSLSTPVRAGSAPIIEKLRRKVLRLTATLLAPAG